MSDNTDAHLVIVSAVHHAVNTVCEAFSVPSPPLGDDDMDDILLAYDRAAEG